MNKFLVVCATFLLIAASIHAADARRQSRKNGGASTSLDHRHIGTFFARKMVMEKMKGGAICTECKEVVQELHTVLSQPNVEQEIQALVDDYLCSSLGAYKQLCQDFVDGELPTIFNELEASLANPQAFCQELGLCKKGSSFMKNAIVLRRRHHVANKKEAAAMRWLKLSNMADEDNDDEMEF